MADYGTELDMLLDIKGAKFKVWVDVNGKFYSSLDGVQYTHETLEGLRQKLMVATRTKSKNISIPVTVLYDRHSSSYDRHSSWSDRDSELVDAEVVGVHAGTKNLLIRIHEKDGKTSTHQAAYGWTIFRRMDATQRATYYANREVARRAITNREAFEKTVAYPKHELSKEIARQLEVKPEELDARV